MFWMPAGDLTPSSDRPFDELHDLFLKMRNLESNSKFLKTYNQVPCFSSFLPVFFKKTPQQFFLNQVWIQRKRGAIKKKPRPKRWHGVLSWVYRRLRRWCGFRRLSSLALEISCRRQRSYGMAWFDYECYRPCEYYTRRIFLCQANLRKRSQSNLSSVQIEAKRTGLSNRQAHVLYILN